MQVIVKEESCIGCGACVSVYPENFDFNGETGLSNAISSDNATPEMAEVCPVGAISLEGGAEETPAEPTEDIAA